MSWQDARVVAELLAARLPDDLNGKVVQASDFETEEDCRYFYPDRALGFHRMVVKAFKRVVWKRGTHDVDTLVFGRHPTLEALDQPARTAVADRGFRILD